MVESLLIGIVPALLKAAADAVEQYHQGQVDHASILARMETALADAQALLAKAKDAHAARVAELAAAVAVPAVP